MTPTPYPSFRDHPPVDEARGVALVAVGRCRIHPTREAIQEIVDTTVKQANVDDEGNSNSNDKGESEEAKKKLRKKLMKEGVALAKTYLSRCFPPSCSVDMVQVEVVLEAADILASKGWLAVCFLDAGCQTIVLDGRNLEALQCISDLEDRLCGHFEYSDKGLFEAIDACRAYCSAVSIEISNKEDITEATMLSVLERFADVSSPQPLTVSMHIPASFDVSKQVVAAVCWAGGTVALLDPTAKQLGSAFTACLKTDREDGLYTTVVCTRNGEALGLVYSSPESIVAALECGRGVYYSRSRKGLWRKGDTSGHVQVLHGIDADCDGDALRFTVTQQTGDETAPAFCHLNTLTCWGMPRGLRHLEETLQDRLKNAPEGSYTKRLFDDSQLLQNKLVEEAQELSEAHDKQHVAEELADLLYFAMVRAVKAGVSLDDAVVELDKRARKVTRRQGDSKDFRIAAGKAILNKKKEESTS